MFTIANNLGKCFVAKLEDFQEKQSNSLYSCGCCQLKAEDWVGCPTSTKPVLLFFVVFVVVNCEFIQQGVRFISRKKVDTAERELERDGRDGGLKCRKRTGFQYRTVTMRRAISCFETASSPRPIRFVAKYWTIPSTCSP